VLGQAAGAAAYLCLKYGATPRELHRNRIEELQQLLLKHDAYIIDLPNQDAGDLARNAKVVASSDAILEVASASGAPDGAGVHNLGALKNAWAPFDTDAALALHIPRGQQFPVGRGRIEAVELLLFSELSQTDVLEAELVKCRRVGDPRDVQPVARSSGEIPPRGWSWVPFPFDVVVGSEAVYDVRLPQAQGIAWGYSAHEPLGTQRTRWYEVFGRWDRVRGSHCFRVLPPARPYGGANIVSGVARPERSANCWISDPTQPLPQWVELHFANPVTFNTVYITFDTNLDVLV
jgi:hypothetical protein